MRKARAEFAMDELRAQARALEAMPEESIDYSDIPASGDLAGWRRRSTPTPEGQAVSVRLDNVLLEAVAARGGDLEPLLNALLREWVSRPKQVAE